MPLVAESDYRASMLFRRNHFSTIYPSLFRRIEGINYTRERLETSDNDFIDLDWSRVGGHRVVVILHGLEGSSSRHYILGMVRSFNTVGYDTVSMNLRGCSGEPNRALRFYHSGETGDLDSVSQHILSMNQYTSIHVVGFSLGGNVALKYLGERGSSLDPKIRSAVAVSVPCDLADSAAALNKPINRIYMKRFVNDLGIKLRQKDLMFPGVLDLTNYNRIRSFAEFDDRYTAPLHGFSGVADYWEKSSAEQFLPSITIPALLINALDDPFLGQRCFPIDIARESLFVYLETPAHGGHVGFAQFGNGEFHTERRAVEFITAHT